MSREYDAKGRIPAGWQWPELNLPEPEQPEQAAFRLRHEPEAPAPEQEPEAEMAPEPLTAEALEAIRQAAYEEGHAEGKEQGLAEGREEGRLKGMQEGHEAGLQQGLEQGLADGETQMQTLLERWNTLTEQLQAPLATIDHTVEQSLVIMAMELARNLLKAEATASPKLLLATVQEALQALPHHEGTLTFYLHAEDMAMLQARYDEAAQAKRGWEFVAEPGLERGELRLSTAMSQLDVSMASRIDELMANFIKANWNRFHDSDAG